MKTTTLLMMGAGFVLTSVSGMAEPTAASELERGVELMANEATVGKAISHFEAVIRQGDDSGRLAAEAWYLLAKCRLALGDEAAALRCVAKLREGWPADNEWVVRAGALLPARPAAFLEAPWAGGELLTYGATVEHEGETMDAGRFASLIVAGGETDDRTWTAWSFNEFDISTCTFKETDFRPISGSFHSMPHGDQILTTGESGEVVLRRKGVDRPVAKFPLQGRGAPVYHFMQVADLVRVLDLAPGTSSTLPMISARNQAEKVTYTITATDPSKIETPAGKFDCIGYRVSSDANPSGETYWVETEGRRKLVKLEMGPMIATLLSVRDSWKPDESYRFPEAAKPGSLSFTVPRGLVAFDDSGHPLPDGEPGDQRIRLYDTQQRVRAGILEYLPLAPEERAAIEQEWLSPEVTKVLLKVVEKPGTVVDEIADARKLSNAGGKFSLTSRYRIERGGQKSEFTTLLGHGKDGMILGGFEHELGAGAKAGKLLEEIYLSL
jgi:hypothetical protein